MRTLANLVTLAASLFVSLVVGEFAARAFFHDITTTADNRSYFALRWKQGNVRLNSFGFRDREVGTAKPPGTFRVALIGDSYAFGQGIPEAERMSNQLEAGARAHGRAVEVLNFGTPGMNTADETAVLHDVLPRVRPDFVLLQWYVNDVEAAPGRDGGARGAPTAGSEPRFGDLRMFMRNHSVLYFLGGEVWHRILDRMGSSRTDDILRRAGDPQSPDALQADRAMREFIALARTANVPVGIVLVPELSPLGPAGYRLQQLHERVLAICRDERLHCVDLFPAFAPYLSDPGAYQRLWVNRFDPHMGVFANRLATETILPVFEPMWAGT